MRAVEIQGAGGPEVLTPCSRPDPEPGPGEVLIRVAAAGVNRPDIMQRIGIYPPPPGASDLPGLEVSGTVTAVGPGVTWPAVGDEVCALVAGGGYAELCLAPAPQCLPIPLGVSLVDAAALPETFFTVWTNLFEDGRLCAGQTALVHGGASGIGVAAIQLAKAFGAQVIVTAGGPERCAKCVEIGADLAVDYKRQDFVEEVKAFTGGDGVDVVLDMIGGDYLARNLACLKTGGRHVTIAFMRGMTPEIDLFAIMKKRLTLTASTLRARDVREKGRLAEALRTFVWPRFADGTLRPVVSHRVPLEEAAEAHRLLEASQHVGKVLLTPTRAP